MLQVVVAAAAAAVENYQMENEWSETQWTNQELNFQLNTKNWKTDEICPLLCKYI